METESLSLDKPNSVPYKFKPIIHKFTSPQNKLPDADPIISTKIPMPLLSLGFQEYLHANITFMKQTTDNFKDRKKVYEVMRLFEPYIDEYDKSIGMMTSEYLGFDKYKILHTNFYELIEIIELFNAIELDSDITTLHLNDKLGHHTLATIAYTEMFAKKKQKNKYYTNSEVSEYIDKNYGKKINNVDIDVNDSKNIKSFLGKNKTKFDFITTQTGYKPTMKVVDGNIINGQVTEEQVTFKTIVNEIYICLKTLNSGGTLVCKCGETYTRCMCEMIYMLSTMFENIYVVKPCASHLSSADRFIVCKNFNNKSKNINNIDTIFTSINKNDGEYIASIFPNMDFDKIFLHEMISLNTEIANNQMIGANDIVRFVNSNNYFGDEYNDRRNEQIRASVYWIDSHYPSNNNIDGILKLQQKLIENVLEANKERLKKYSSLK